MRIAESRTSKRKWNKPLPLIRLTPMISSFEKRRHQRLNLALPLIYKLYNQEGKDYKKLKGVTKNISMGGIYFVCLAPQSLAIKQVMEIAIELPKQDFELPGTNILKTRGEVLRIEKLPQRPYAKGVALQLIENLSFPEP
ncbi:MAG: hypothetical protein DRG58_05175 [Deltaproteobacteria bacterium]|nr:MAG: hypothetical protein DRG58_05175 [Deltaproteobacteria bacterium]